MPTQDLNHRSKLAIHHIHHFGFGNIRAEVVNLDTQCLTQTKHEGSVILPRLSQVQRSGHSRQQQSTHQLAGLRSVTAQLLSTANRGDVVSVVNRYCIQLKALIISEVLHVEDDLFGHIP